MKKHPGLTPTATGRLAQSKPVLQNIPLRTAEVARVVAAFVGGVAVRHPVVKGQPR